MTGEQGYDLMVADRGRDGRHMTYDSTERDDIMVEDRDSRPSICLLRSLSPSRQDSFLSNTEQDPFGK